MKSQFTTTAYFYALLIITFPLIQFLLYKFSNIEQVFQYLDGSWGLTVFYVFLGIINFFVLFWGLFVEINMRMAKISFTENGFEVKKFLGLGRTYVYAYSDFDGFVLRNFRTRGRHQEYCYLVSNQTPLVVFSSTYFKNYMDIRAKFAENMKQL